MMDLGLGVRWVWSYVVGMVTGALLAAAMAGLYLSVTPDDPKSAATQTPACHRVGETASGAVLMECP